MTLFELQEHCLANAVDAEISGDSMTATVRAKSNAPNHCIDAPILARVSLVFPADRQWQFR